MELITSRPVFNAPKSWSLTSRRRKKPPSFTVLMPDVTVKSSDTWKSAVLRPRGRSHVCPPTSMSSPAPSGGFTQGFGPAVLKKLPSANALVCRGSAERVRPFQLRLLLRLRTPHIELAADGIGIRHLISAVHLIAEKDAVRWSHVHIEAESDEPLRAQISLRRSKTYRARQCTRAKKLGIEVEIPAAIACVGLYSVDCGDSGGLVIERSDGLRSIVQQTEKLRTVECGNIRSEHIRGTRRLIAFQVRSRSGLELWAGKYDGRRGWHKHAQPFRVDKEESFVPSQRPPQRTL